jgi:hypothetical protein
MVAAMVADVGSAWLGRFFLHRSICLPAILRNRAGERVCDATGKRAKYAIGQTIRVAICKRVLDSAGKV